MDRQFIINKLSQLIGNALNDSSFTIIESENALSMITWDSLCNLVILSSIERSFAFKFKLKDLNRMKTINDLIEIIETNVK